MVFWAIHKLYASKHISRGEVVVTTLAKASPGNLTEKKSEQRRGRRRHGCCDRRVKVKKGGRGRRCRALEQCLKTGTQVDAVLARQGFICLQVRRRLVGCGCGCGCGGSTRRRRRLGKDIVRGIFQDFDCSSD
ncbi:hypothetical protein PVAP13_4KG186100 [Panicum virgatum]|uniref:Uncharacterized protein n=1 Tax=Panicum virgatum TaxID=38727 RepID=A0A8T0TNB3_PANVG|nr:hypothetical protein PVAP13_4KG186100 [Panicum virgatum]